MKCSSMPRLPTLTFAPLHHNLSPYSDRICDSRGPKGPLSSKFDRFLVPARAIGLGISLAKWNSVALKVTRWSGQRGLRRPPQKLREATDKANSSKEGDEVTGAISSPFNILGRTKSAVLKSEDGLESVRNAADTHHINPVVVFQSGQISKGNNPATKPHRLSFAGS